MVMFISIKTCSNSQCFKMHPGLWTAGKRAAKLSLISEHSVMDCGSRCLKVVFTILGWNKDGKEELNQQFAALFSNLHIVILISFRKSCWDFNLLTECGSQHNKYRIIVHPCLFINSEWFRLYSWRNRKRPTEMPWCFFPFLPAFLGLRQYALPFGIAKWDFLTYVSLASFMQSAISQYTCQFYVLYQQEITHLCFERSLTNCCTFLILSWIWLV